jgi:hypothetical protein
MGRGHWVSPEKILQAKTLEASEHGVILLVEVMAPALASRQAAGRMDLLAAEVRFRRRRTKAPLDLWRPAKYDGVADVFALHSRRGSAIQTCAVGEKDCEMTGKRFKALTNILAALAMVTVYFVQVVAISGLTVSATSTSADARRGRDGRRGWRGGRGCPLWMWEAWLC